MKTLLGYNLSPLWEYTEGREDWKDYWHSFLKLQVIESWHPAPDGRTWLHVSLSREDRIPSYEDIKVTKRTFVGDDHEAYQVFPPVERHVNINPNVLHLFCWPDGPVLPDFTSMTRAGKRTL
jgi:hypothetical protein